MLHRGSRINLYRPLASCRRRLLARVEASLWPASATLHTFGLMQCNKPVI
jgi:hypothetical protein